MNNCDGDQSKQAKSEASLRAAITEYAREGTADGVAGGARETLRLHIPGHKGGSGVPPALRDRWGSAVFRDDVTEVPGTDDLAAPAGPIAAAQAAAAAAYGAGAASFVVQGTTGGLIALFLAAARHRPAEGRRQVVVLPRFSHRAMVSAAVLADVSPAFCRTSFVTGLPCGPDPQDLRRVLNYHGADVVAVVDTYPSMYGVAHDLGAVAAIAHDAGVPLYVDGAHASLYGLDARLPAAPLAAGADAVVLSAHKDLGSLTGSSLLLVAERPLGASAPEISAALRLTTTTSPSYLFMLSLEAAVEHRFSAAGRAELRAAIDAALDARAELAAIGVPCLVPQGQGLVPDPLRLNIDAWAAGLTGMDLAFCLRQREGVQVETAGWRSVLAILGPGDGAGTGHRLVDALRTARAGGHQACYDEFGAMTASPARATRLASARRLDALQQTHLSAARGAVLSPRQAWLAAREQVGLEQAAGRVAAEAVSPYPPGVPLVWPGEMIGPETVELVSAILDAGGGLHGVSLLGAAGCLEGKRQVSLAVVAGEWS